MLVPRWVLVILSISLFGSSFAGEDVPGNLRCDETLVAVPTVEHTRLREGTLTGLLGLRKPSIPLQWYSSYDSSRWGVTPQSDPSRLRTFFSPTGLLFLGGLDLGEHQLFLPNSDRLNAAIQYFNRNRSEGIDPIPIEFFNVERSAVVGLHRAIPMDREVIRIPVALLANERSHDFGVHVPTLGFPYRWWKQVYWLLYAYQLFETSLQQQVGFQAVPRTAETRDSIRHRYLDAYPANLLGWFVYRVPTETNKATSGSIRAWFESLSLTPNEWVRRFFEDQGEPIKRVFWENYLRLARDDPHFKTLNTLKLDTSRWTDLSNGQEPLDEFVARLHELRGEFERLEQKRVRELAEQLH